MLQYCVYFQSPSKVAIQNHSRAVLDLERWYGSPIRDFAAQLVRETGEVDPGRH
jgi:hypothetical protein